MAKQVKSVAPVAPVAVSSAALTLADLKAAQEAFASAQRVFDALGIQPVARRGRKSAVAPIISGPTTEKERALQAINVNSASNRRDVLVYLLDTGTGKYNLGEIADGSRRTLSEAIQGLRYLAKAPIELAHCAGFGYGVDYGSGKVSRDRAVLFFAEGAENPVDSRENIAAAVEAARKAAEKALVPAAPRKPRAAKKELAPVISLPAPVEPEKSGS